MNNEFDSFFFSAGTLLQEEIFKEEICKISSSSVHFERDYRSVEK